MSSTNGDADDLDPETEAAVRRAVRAEIRGAVRAVSQIGGGLLFGFFAIPALAAVLLALNVSLTVVFLLWVGGLFALAAYAWEFPPFN